MRISIPTKVSIYTLNLLGLILLAGAAAYAQPDPAPREPVRRLDEILNPDGTLKLEPGTRGRFAADGYELVRDAGTFRVVYSERARRLSERMRAAKEHEQGKTSHRIQAAPDDDRWDTRFGGSASLDIAAVYAVAIDGGDVYVGGSFLRAGDVNARNVAKWSGGTWVPLGEGVNGPVFALGAANGEVYVGGTFDSAGTLRVSNIARWSSGGWNTMGEQDINGVGSPAFDLVYTITTAGDEVYVGGFFDRAGNRDAGNIARWNRTANQWSTLGDDQLNGVYGEVYSIVLDGANVFVGGSFSEAGGVAAGNIARWNSASGEWTPLGDGVDGNVLTMAAMGGKLYVGGGAVSLAGGVEVRRIAVWDISGGTWAPLGGNVVQGIDGRVVSIVASGSDLYVSGTFNRAGTTDVSNLARWDGQKWNAVGGGVRGPVEKLAVSGSTLYAGGQFVLAGSTEARYVAKWDGSAWSSLGSGISLGNGASVQAIAVDGDIAYVGGRFLTAGSSAASNVAGWNGATGNWFVLGSDQGSGVNGPVSSLAVGNDGDLYVSGLFTEAGGVPAVNVARWTRSTGAWAPLGDGLMGLVRSLAVTEAGVLYAGGVFALPAQPGEAHSVARWNSGTNSWSIEGGGPESKFPLFDATEITTDGDQLYAVGVYAKEEGEYEGVLRWNGVEWTSLLDSAAGEITAVAADAGSLYIAVAVYTNGDPATVIMKRGTNGEWAPVGTPEDSLNGVVDDIHFVMGGLHIGGLFTSRAEEPVRNIAHFDGGWKGLGSGTNGEVHAIQSDSPTDQGKGVSIFLGGTFTTAGETPSRSFARFATRINTSVDEAGSSAIARLIAVRPNPVSGSTLISFDLPTAGHASLTILDPLGRRVSAPVEWNRISAGRHEFLWDASHLPAGTYFAALTVAGGTGMVPVVVTR